MTVISTLQTFNIALGASVAAADTYVILAGAGYAAGGNNASVALLMSASATLHNFGTLSGVGTGLTISAVAVSVANAGAINGGTYGVFASASGQTNATLKISNSGTISGQAAGIYANGSASMLIENSGTITGDVAVTWDPTGENGVATPSFMEIYNTGFLLSANSYALAAKGTDHTLLQNSGIVHGAVDMRSNGVSTIYNTGIIRSDVYLLDLAGGAEGRGVYRAGNNGVVLGTVYGDMGRDEFLGGAGRDQFVTGAGDDSLRGYGGSDSLSGGSGADRLRGGADDDLLQGGTGADRIWGGADDDTFIYTATNESSGASGIDTITDFNRAEDVIDLSALAGTGRFVGTRKFKADGSFQVREMWNKQTKIGTLLVDTNGDRVVDMSITLNGQTGLITNDNLLL